MSRAYDELARLGARAVGEHKPWPYQTTDVHELIVLIAHLTRYDPRLFGILTEYLYFHWRDLNPLKLRDALKKFDTPQTFLTAFGFAASGLDHPEVWATADYLATGFHPVAPQLYFINLYSPGSSSMSRAAREPLDGFLKWGFLARERPVIHDGGKRTLLGHWSGIARRNMATRLLTQHGKLALGEYLEAVEHTISRQQALEDLKAHPLLVVTGKGRGSMWKMAKRRRATLKDITHRSLKTYR